MRECQGYPSTYLYVWDQIARKKSRQEIIGGLIEAGYSKRQAQKTYVSYRNRYFKMLEHINGRHDSIPGGCHHWLPKGFVRKKVDIMPPLPGDVFQAHRSNSPEDWISFV